MIFVSAGHYPTAPGAKFERFIEHDEAVVWTNMLIDKLNSFVTPPDIQMAMYVPTGVLRSKITYVNDRVMDGDIAIEIHFNAAKDRNGNNVGQGCETLYYPGSEAGRSLAETVQKALSVAFPPDRGVKEGWYRMDPSKGADFFLAKTSCTAVIIEPEFVHHAELITVKREEAVNLVANSLKDWIDVGRQKKLEG